MQYVLQQRPKRQRNGSVLFFIDIPCFDPATAAVIIYGTEFTDNTVCASKGQTHDPNLFFPGCFFNQNRFISWIGHSDTLSMSIKI